MIIDKQSEYKIGYNSILEIDAPDNPSFMSVGIIKLDKGDRIDNDQPLERAFLLIEGSVHLQWQGHQELVTRKSCFDENPICLHVPAGVEVRIEGQAASELMYQAVRNDRHFEAKLFGQQDTVSDIFGKDVLNNTSIRTVRTIIDDDIAPYSNLVIGEVINHPGRWSSYPPHYHVQPEVYHYRFLPANGFGFSLIGEEASKVEHGSTSVITSNVVHPQCAAPGYAMYYVWMIPHQPKRWLKDRTFAEQHDWLNDKAAKIWAPK